MLLGSPPTSSSCALLHDNNESPPIPYPRLPPADFDGTSPEALAVPLKFSGFFLGEEVVKGEF